MKNIRVKLDKLFGNITRLIFKRKYLTLFIMFVLVAAVTSQMSKLRIDNSNEGYFKADDPTLKIYDKFRDQFGRDELIILAIKSDTIYNLDYLEKLKNLHMELKDNVPYLEEITSILNTRYTHGEKDKLIVEDLLKEFPKNQKDLDVLKERVRGNEFYENIIVSKDEKYSTVIIETQNYSTENTEEDVLSGFDDESESENNVASSNDGKNYLTDVQNSKAVDAVRTIVSKYNSKDFQVFYSGSALMIDAIKKNMLRDMRIFMALAFLTVAAFLFIMFRRISGIVLPLVVVILSILSTMGLMGFNDAPINMVSQIIPSFLLAVGVSASVHVLVIFYRKFNEIKNKEEAMVYSIEHCGLAIVMTSVTTSVGLLSFSSADIAPVADLGIYAGIAVLITLLFTIILLPALIAIIPLKPVELKKHESGDKTTLLDRILSGIGECSIKYPFRIMFGAFLIVILSVVGITKINFVHHPLIWLPEDDIVRIGTEQINADMKGSINLEVIIDTGKENGLYDPVLLKKLEKSIKHVEGLRAGKVYAGKAWSLTTIIKETNRALNENKSNKYTVPNDKKLIAQELLLFENSGSDDLEDFVDSQFRLARFTMKLPSQDAHDYMKFIQKVNKHFKEDYKGHDVDINVTGMAALFSKTFTNAISSMAQSYKTALILITILMIFLIGRLRIGLLSMIPNIIPIVIMLGAMGWIGMPMDMFAMLVGSIAIGLAVDDTIHFMHNFRKYFELTGDAEEAVRKTMHTTGRAMIVTSCVLSIGFFIYMFAYMTSFYNFGLLTGFTIIMALMADFFVAPALMVIVNRKKEEPVRV